LPPCLSHGDTQPVFQHKNVSLARITRAKQKTSRKFSTTRQPALYDFSDHHGMPSIGSSHTL
jgi:hypothetical protein